MKLTVKEKMEELVMCLDHIKALMTELLDDDIKVLAVNADKAFNKAEVHMTEDSLKYVAIRNGFTLEKETNCIGIEETFCYDGRVRLFAVTNIPEEDKENETV